MNERDRIFLFVILLRELASLYNDAMIAGDYANALYYSQQQCDLLDAAFDVAESKGEVLTIGNYFSAEANFEVS